MVYLIYPDVELWNFVLECSNENATMRPLNRYCNKLQLFFRKKIKHYFHLPFLYLGRKIRKELSGLKSGDSIILCDYTDVNLAQAIKDCIIDDVRMYIWLWNPLKGDWGKRIAERCEEIRRIGYTISTFDPSDSLKYGFSLRNQFYKMNQHQDSVVIENDFYFLGFAKGREIIINSLKKKLSKYNCYFKVVNNSNEVITYYENVENIKKTKCVVDIVQDGQCGMTLRPLEAITFRKKLISNNKSLKNMDFYHPNNIFILGDRDMSEIDDFMCKPYFLVNDSVIMRYDVTKWIDSFCN